MSEPQLAKIAVSMDADDALTTCLEIVNAGFLGGRVTKTTLASWLITQGAKTLTDKKMDAIRNANFNQSIYLEGLAKKLKISGQRSLDAKEIAELKRLFASTKSKKTNKKAQGTESTEVLKDKNAA